MAKPRTIESLQVKKAEVEWAVKAYEAKLNQSRKDLDHLNAALAIFEASGDRKAMTAYVNYRALWKHGELFNLCMRVLESEGPLSTREMTLRILRSEGMDTADEVLIQTVVQKITHIMRRKERLGAIVRAGMRADVCVWACPIKARGPAERAPAASINQNQREVERLRIALGTACR
jgi:hypothetical protein